MKIHGNFVIVSWVDFSIGSEADRTKTLHALIYCAFERPKCKNSRRLNTYVPTQDTMQTTFEVSKRKEHLNKTLHSIRFRNQTNHPRSPQTREALKTKMAYGHKMCFVCSFDVLNSFVGMCAKHVTLLIFRGESVSKYWPRKFTGRESCAAKLACALL